VISGGGAGGQSALRKSGSGRLIYSAANTFSGDTRVDGGTLQIANDLALQNSAIDTTGVGVFDFTTVTTPTVGGLKGGINLASVITSGYTGITALTLNTFNAAPLTPYSYSGVIADGAAGMSLTKSGTGTQVLSGVNTYTGDTIITSGTLSLTNACLADGADVRVSAMGVLNLNYVGTDTVDEFYVNGVQQFSGTWGAIGSGASHQTARITGTGILNVVTGSVDVYGNWALAKGLDDSDAAHSSARSADPDGDGVNNLAEFAFDGNPLSAASDGKIVGKIATVGADQVLTLTLPVRSGATFSGATEQVSNLVDTVIYRVQGSSDLGTFGNVISEVTGGEAAAIQSGLPGLSSGWSYRSFRTAGTVSTVSKDFMRARVTE
jgi:autotransporter-associated beta strand protein